MNIHYPALITSAIFFGAIVVNLHNRFYGTVIFTSLVAIPSILLMVFLSQKNLDILAYILLLAPICLVIAGYVIGVQNNSPSALKPTLIPQLPNAKTNTLDAPPITKVPDRIEPKMS
jgi:energy-converting hydrogenase Eha subunit C